VSDDDRNRRRLGDATKGRIADLASGWDVPASPSATPDPGEDLLGEPLPELTRKKPRTAPPPAPGSAARAALETAMADVSAPAPPAPRAAPRTKPPTAPPPPRAKGTTQQPLGPAPLKRITPPAAASGPTSAPTTAVPEARSGRVTGPQVPEARSGRVTGPQTVPEARSGRVTGPHLPPTGTTPAPVGVMSSPSTRTAVPPPERSGRVSEPPPLPPAARSGRVTGAQAAIPSSPVPAAPSGPTFFGQPVGQRSQPPPPTPGGTSHLAPRRPKPTSIPPPTGAALIPQSASQALVIAATSPKQIVDATAVDPPSAARPDPTDVEPPTPPERAASEGWALAAPPPARVAKPPRQETEEISLEELEPEPEPEEPEPAPEPVRAAPSVPNRSGAVPVVPLGEFEHGPTMSHESDKMRTAYAQATVKRDAASALLGLPEPPPTIVRPPPVQTLLEESAVHIASQPDDPQIPATVKFERGDPTTSDHGVTASISDRAPVAGRLRPNAALRRKRGLGGDVRYVFTVLFGVRDARGELVALEAEQATKKAERRRNLVTLGRTALITDLDHPALSRVSDRLAAVEDERAGHAAQVAAADQELARVRRDREAKIKQHAEGVAAIEAELYELDKKQQPLDKELAAIKKRAASVHDALKSIDRRLHDVEASRTNIRTQKLDPATISAELATLRADRKSVERDEPAVAADQDALEPRIAALEAARSEAKARRKEIDEEEGKDQRRVAELLEAIGAKRKVVDRAASDAETLRDNLLFELGEALYVDRPRSLAAQLAPIDEIDVELGTTERRMMELREILSSVDKAKLARGIAVIVGVLGAIAGFVVLLIMVSQ